MKELQQEIKDKIKSADQREIKKELKLIGKLTPKPGQKVWKLNLTTEKVTEAAVEVIASFMVGKKHVEQRKLVVENDCWYVAAINKENACRKFLKMLNNI